MTEADGTLALDMLDDNLTNMLRQEMLRHVNDAIDIGLGSTVRLPIPQ